MLSVKIIRVEWWNGIKLIEINLHDNRVDALRKAAKLFPTHAHEMTSKWKILLISGTSK